MKIETNATACTGCRICELVCSFHHQRVFAPELSSIKVTRNNRNGEVEMSINTTCDFCQGEKQLLCVQTCCFGVLVEVR